MNKISTYYLKKAIENEGKRKNLNRQTPPRAYRLDSTLHRLSEIYMRPVHG